MKGLHKKKPRTCNLGADRGGDISYISHHYSLYEDGKNTRTFAVYAKYVKDEYSDQYFNEYYGKPDCPEYMFEMREYLYPMKKENGKWVFTDFSSYI